jgi:hypothetical protein
VHVHRGINGTVLRNHDTLGWCAISFVMRMGCVGLLEGQYSMGPALANHPPGVVVIFYRVMDGTHRVMRTDVCILTTGRPRYCVAGPIDLLWH